MIINKKYEVSFEIGGPMAAFMRPDSGATFVSYPCPTYSSMKGVFECVVRLRTAYIRPTRVHICRPIVYQKYSTNYNGPLRKSESIKNGNPYQLVTNVLVNVVYQCFGVVEELEPPPGNFNHLHYLQDKFNRRIRQGRFFSTPALGWSEFIPDYFGPLRSENGPLETVNEVIPSMLLSVFDKPENGRYAPVYQQNVKIEKGVLIYAQ